MSNVVTSPRPHELVHVAVIRSVRKGREAEFETHIARFFDTAAEQRGVCGAYLIRPAMGDGPSEYGILRSFRSKQAMRRFYESDLYRRWKATVQTLVEGEPRMREVHGLEAFFRDHAAAPPRWKMALLSWIAVTPAVYAFSLLVPLFAQLPGLVALPLVTACVVAALSWVLMPLLTRLFRPWLRRSTK